MKKKIIEIVCGALLLSGVAFGDGEWNECGEKKVECGEIRLEKCEEECKSRNGFYLGATGSLVFGAKDQSDAYVEEMRVISSTVNLKAGSGVSLMIGGAINQFRIELEAMSRTSKVKSVEVDVLGNRSQIANTSRFEDMRTVALMLNLFYDIPFKNNFGMYLGAGGGLGLTLGKVTVDLFDGTSNQKLLTGSAGLAYQFLSGLTYDLTDHATAYLGYRFFGYEAKGRGNGIIDKLKLKFSSHSIDIGIRYRF